jgi:hypothetical protein
MKKELANKGQRVYYPRMTKHTDTVEIFFYDSEGEEVTLDVPFKWEICDRCDGKGQHDNPAFSDGISGEEWNNEWDDEERESYMRGAYDVRCENDCDNGKVRSPDLTGLTEEQRKDYEDHLDQEAYNDRERAAERRWGY